MKTLLAIVAGVCLGTATALWLDARRLIDEGEGANSAR